MGKIMDLITFLLIMGAMILVVAICYMIQQSKVNAMEMPSHETIIAPDGAWELSEEGIEKL